MSLSLMNDPKSEAAGQDEQIAGKIQKKVGQFREGLRKVIAGVVLHTFETLSVLLFLQSPEFSNGGLSVIRPNCNTSPIVHVSDLLVSQSTPEC
jgi:hypothetical protein